jgi:hypothetical protein
MVIRISTFLLKSLQTETEHCRHCLNLTSPPLSGHLTVYGCVRLTTQTHMHQSVHMYTHTRVQTHTHTLKHTHAHTHTCSHHLVTIPPPAWISAGHRHGTKVRHFCDVFGKCKCHLCEPRVFGLHLYLNFYKGLLTTSVACFGIYSAASD